MSLIAWYPLIKDTNDYSGNNFHLTNNGGVIDPNGKIGQCYNLAPDKFMESSSAFGDKINKKQMTVSLWIKYQWENVSNTYLCIGQDAMIIDTQQNGSIRFFIYDGPVVVTAQCQSDKWTHICGTYDNGTLKIYVNGTLANKTTMNYAPKFAKGDKLLLGKRVSSNTCNAFINDVRVYDEALTAKQIYEISKAKIFHYVFNEYKQETTKNLLTSKTYWNIESCNAKWQNDNSLILDVYSSNTAGMHINRNLNITNIKKDSIYTLSYKLKKISGTLEKIRGHMENESISDPKISILSTKLNGVAFELPSQYREGIQLYDTSETCEIEITFKVLKDNIDPFYYIWIQPNAFNDIPVKVKIWDLQLENKPYATSFTPNERTNTVLDISGYNKNIITSYNTEPEFYHDEKMKNCFNFNGIDHCLQFKESYNTTDELTITAWVNLSNYASEYSTICTKEDTHYFSIDHIGRLCAFWYERVPEGYHVSTKTIPLNTWSFVSVVWAKESVKLYINGTLDKNNVCTGNGINNDKNIWIGKQNFKRAFDGKISDLRIYATALSDKDIKLLYSPETSIDKKAVIRCSQINEYKDKNIGFKKDGSIVYKEFNEIPIIKSGIHDLKLGDEILPVLIDMDNDGGRWARVFYHNCKGGTVLFNHTNNHAEAKEVNKTAPTTSDKYSILSKLEFFRFGINSDFELKLSYPTDFPNKSNIWKQSSNFTFENVSGYKPLKIDWTNNYWGGLEYGKEQVALADGSIKNSSWFYAIGAASKYLTGIPGYNQSIENDVELWVRINDYSLFVNSNISNVSISKDGIITAKEFNEIDN